MNITNHKETIIKVSKIVLNVLFYAFVLLILLFAIANTKVKTTADFPNIFGTGFLSVQSNSMDGDEKDSFKQGDLIFVNVLNDKERDALKVGDIVTFYGMFYSESEGKQVRALNTHRIVEVGESYFVTQGDWVAKQPGRKYDPNIINDENNYEIINKKEALAVHKSTWRSAGKTLDYLQTSTGFGLFIVLPTVLILGVEGFFLVKNILKINQEKMEEKFKQKDEEMRKQIMEELKKEQELKKEEESQNIDQ